MQLDLMVESKIGPERFRELGLLAEQYGFRTMWAQNYARAPDAFMTAVPLAMAAKSIRVGVVVVSPYEMHPVKIANAVLTLNEMCAGGAAVVIGGGGEWPGVLAVPLGKRITGTREAIELVKRAASEDGGFSYEGEVYSARGFSTYWKSDKPPPQIYGGATGPKMIAMATAVADGLMMSDVQPEMFDWPMPNLKEALAARQDQGRFGVSNFLAWHVKEDAEESFAEARRELVIRGWIEREWLEPYLNPDEVALVLANKWPFLKAFRERHGNIEGVAPDLVHRLVEGLSMAGGPDSVDRHIERMLQFKAAGFTELSIGLQEDPEYSIRMLGERVLPALK